MAENIKVFIRERRAQVEGAPVIVCGNSDYTITFDFDSDWSQTGPKTARFVYVKGGEVLHEDKVFQSKTVAVPVLSDVSFVDVGVFAGDLCTTTPARIRCKKSILCGSGEVHEPTPDVYAQIMALFEDMAEQGAFGATEEQAQQIETNRQNIAAQAEALEALRGDVNAEVDRIVSGEQQVGDSKKLGGETAEEWQGKIDRIETVKAASLSKTGWYRIAQRSRASVTVTTTVNISIVARLCQTCNIKLTRQGLELIDSRSSTHVVRKARYVTDGNYAYIDIYVKYDGSINYKWAVGDALIIGTNLASAYTWSATEPIEVDDVVDGETVGSIIDIAENASPQTSVDVKEAISGVKNTISAKLSTKGWHRIATGTASASTSIITLRNIFNSGGADAVTLLYQTTVAGNTYNNAQIVQLGASCAKNMIFTDVRVVKIEGGVGIDVYYNHDAENTCYFGLLNLYSPGEWRTCAPVFVENEYTEADIVISYNIVKNAQPVLNTELETTLANYLPKTGGTVDALTIGGAGGDEGGELRLVKPQTNNLFGSDVAVDVYQNQVRFHATHNGLQKECVFDFRQFKETGITEALHTGNSEKVAVKATAPPDGVWIW